MRLRVRVGLALAVGLALVVGPVSVVELASVPRRVSTHRIQQSYLTSTTLPGWAQCRSGQQIQSNQCH